MDNLSPSRRSENMRAIRAKNTTPEMVVRRLVYSLGFRYRLHGAHLPGKPDLVFSGLKKVIFIHGCFWHSHARCKEAHVPKTRQDYWAPKLNRNKTRDVENRRKLRVMGWDVLVLWECQLAQVARTTARIMEFLVRGAVHS